MHDSDFIEWDRLGEKPTAGEPVFFTDSCLQMANMNMYQDAYKIAWLIEPPVIRPDTYNYIANNHDKFNLVLTHQKEFLKVIPNGAWYPSHMSWVKRKDWGVHPKSNLISIVASDKNYADGHKLRHQLIKSYHVDHRPFDIYGSCTGKFLEDKADALKDYRFHITIENSQTYGYYTEKLVDCFSTYTIPIYWGCLDIAEYFDVRGMLCCNSLKELQDTIGQIIHYTPEEVDAVYQNMMPYMQKNFELASKYYSPEDYIYQEIIAKLGQS